MKGMGMTSTVMDNTLKRF